VAVVLSVTSGPAKGKVFTFTEHDTFLFERMPDCHASFPDDTQVSRHHFILEACPPKASLRDHLTRKLVDANLARHDRRRQPASEISIPPFA